MTWFFILTLLVSLFLVLALFWLLVIRLNVNWNHQNKVPMSYLLPALITVLLVGVVVTDSQKRIKDFASIIGNNTGSVEVKAGSWQRQGNLLLSADESLILPAFARDLDPETSYRIIFAPNSKLVLDIRPISLDKEAQ